MAEGWGVGTKANEPAFDKAAVGKNEVELFFGEHPHSRQDNNIYARWPNGRIDEFDGHRRPVEIEIAESNYLKESDLSGDEIRRGGEYVIKISGVPVDGDFCRSWESAFRRIQWRLPQILEHSVRWEREGEWLNRPVYYENVPAYIRSFIGEQGCVVIEAAEGHSFPSPAWANEEDGSASYWEDHRQSVKTDILSSSIWWFRREVSR